MSEDQIREAFTNALATLAPPTSREVFEAIITQTCDTIKLEQQLAQEALARDAVVTRLNQLIATNGTHAQNQDTYQHTFDQLQADYERHAQRYDDLESQIRQTHEKRQHIERFHIYRINHPALEYSDDAWNTLIDYATIHTNGTIEFSFKDSTNLTVTQASS